MAFSSSIVRLTLLALERSNVPRHEVSHGIVEESRLREDFWLPDAAYYEMLSRAVLLSHDPALGLTVGQWQGNWLALGAAGLHISLVRCFSEAAAAIVRFHGLLHDTQSVVSFQDAETLTIQFDAFDAPLFLRQFLAEAALGSVRELLAQFVGRDAKPSRVSLDYPAPRHAAQYQKVFGCEVSFDQPHAALVVPRAIADKEQLLHQPELAEHLAQLAESSMGHGRNVRRVDERVRALMRNGHSGAPSMAVIARRLGVSERSLRRQLASEGMHYRSLLAEDRCALATQLLRRGAGPKQIAYELGYQSTSAFHRAFRRWAGASPSAFAAHHRPSTAAPNP